MLEEPEQEYAPTRRASRTGPKMRRDYGEDFAEPYENAREEEDHPRQRGIRLRLRPGMPKSLLGRILTGMALLMIAGAGLGLLMLTRSFLLHDSRFVIASPASIEVQGNHHLTREQLLSIFGDDVGRNIFRISLDDRETQLEQLPWIEHATIMRLLPNRIRVSLIERTPIAFARQGGHIGLVDGNGVLLEMNGVQAAHYSFPVVTGIVSTDPASTRAARMKIYERFIADLDSSNEKISQTLSEVDLSNPEDVRALIPANSRSILVHFGEDHFLERYHRFKLHLAAWQAQYPNLSSVDMRYEREVVLDMANQGAATMPGDAPAEATVKSAVTKPAVAPAHKQAAHPGARSAPREKPAAHRPAPPVKKPQTHAPAKPVSKPHAASKPPDPAASTHPAPSVSAMARESYHAKPSAGKPLPGDASPSSHSAQVPSR